MNAKQELLKRMEAIGKGGLYKSFDPQWESVLPSIKAIKIKRMDLRGNTTTLLAKAYPVSMKDLDVLDFEYDNGYGYQEIDGIVLFSDNSWLERWEYDGSEGWEYKKAPTIRRVLEES